MEGDDGERLVSHEHHICTHGLSVVEGDDVVAEQLVNNALLFDASLFFQIRQSTTSQRAQLSITHLHTTIVVHLEQVIIMSWSS